MPAPLSPEYVQRAAAALGVLSHETRLQAVLLIAVLHLRILRDAGLVSDRRDGQYILYRIDVSTWQELSDGFFDSLLGGDDAVTLRNIRIERLPGD